MIEETAALNVSTEQLMTVICFPLLQITDDITWAEELIQRVDEQCLFQLSFNITIFITINGVIELPSLFDDICPSDCSGHGACEQGKILLL